MENGQVVDGMNDSIPRNTYRIFLLVVSQQKNLVVLVILYFKVPVSILMRAAIYWILNDWIPNIKYGKLKKTLTMDYCIRNFGYREEDFDRAQTIYLLWIFDGFKKKHPLGSFSQYLLITWWSSGWRKEGKLMQKSIVCLHRWNL
jgi:hypothetical protein